MNRFYVHFNVLHISPAAEFVLILCFDLVGDPTVFTFIPTDFFFLCMHAFGKDMEYFVRKAHEKKTRLKKSNPIIYPIKLQNWMVRLYTNLKVCHNQPAKSFRMYLFILYLFYIYFYHVFYLTASTEDVDTT